MDCLTKKDFASVGEIKGAELNSMFSRVQLQRRVVHVLLMNRPKNWSWTVEREGKGQLQNRSKCRGCWYYLVTSQKVLDGGQAAAEGFLLQKDRSTMQELILLSGSVIGDNALQWQLQQELSGTYISGLPVQLPLIWTHFLLFAPAATI